MLQYMYSLAEHNIWLSICQEGEKPMSRDGHACTSIGPEMFIHGGFSSSVSDSPYINASFQIWPYTV